MMDRGKRKRILAAIDTTDSARYVIEKTAEIAEMVGADVTVLTVVDLPLVASEGEVNMAKMVSEEKKISEYHRELIDRYFGGSTGILVESMIQYGDAGDKICEIAERIHADMVVIGSRGLGRIESMLLGSVSEKVLRKCRCSVLVVKAVM